MIHPGTDIKWKVTAHAPAFSMSDDDFVITVAHRWGEVHSRITKDRMLCDDTGSFYFQLHDLQPGTYIATFEAKVTDYDFQDHVRNIPVTTTLIVIPQPQCQASSHRFGRPLPPPDPTPVQPPSPPRVTATAGGCTVTYEPTFYVSIGDGAYLADADGNPILDGSGNPIFLTGAAQEQKDRRLGLTIEELRLLLEGRNDNGHIDTIPELFDAAATTPENSRFAPADDIPVMVPMTTEMLDIVCQ